MDTQNKYQDALTQIQENFQEEAACHLPEDTIAQILQAETSRLHFAEQHKIPLYSWIGSNTRRYCKDLLRRQQPFFPLYYLLSICTEASIVLFFFYLIQSLLRYLSVSLSFAGVPGAVLALFLAKEWSKAYTGHCLEKKVLPKTGYRILIWIFSLAIVSVIFLLTWAKLLPLLQKITLLNSFLAYVMLLFLSGIHNVLYSSHLITFFAIGALPFSRRPPAEQAAAIEHYMQEREKTLLAARKKTVAEMNQDPALYADIHMDIHSQLVTNRIYLTLALFILIILDFVCIYQYAHLHVLSVLAFGIASILCSGILLICLLSCNTLLRRTLSD